MCNMKHGLSGKMLHPDINRLEVTALKPWHEIHCHLIVRNCYHLSKPAAFLAFAALLTAWVLLQFNLALR